MDDKMQCSPHCPFFQDSICPEWERDENFPYIKKRIVPANFKCSYDGHKITSWYTPCPKKLEEFFKGEKKK